MKRHGYKKLWRSIDALYLSGVDKDRPPRFRKRLFTKLYKQMRYHYKVKQLQESYPNIKEGDPNTRDIINMIDRINNTVIFGNLL